MTRVADLLYRWRAIPWIVMGIVLTTTLFDPVRFWLYPVAKMEGEVAARGDGFVIVRIQGKKLRGVECEYLGRQAFGDRLIGPPVELYITRLDRPEDGKTKPPGTYDVGLWDIRPTLGVTRVRVYVTHNCEGTRWATEIASINI